MFRPFSLALAGFALSLAAHAQTKWDLPSGYPTTNFHTETLTQFAADVDKATDGKLKITVHPNGSLFKANEIKRAVQGNQAQAGEIILAGYANEWPIYEADGIPFLADSYEQAMKLYQAQKPLLQKKLAAEGMLMLYSVAWPPQGIYSKKPLASGADLKGVKWRAYSPTTSKIASMLGAQPVTVQQAELSQAMATGVVESYMSSGSTGDDTKTYEHLKYFYDMQAWLPKNMVIVNKKAFDALDKASQDAIMTAAASAEVRGWAASKKVNDSSLASLKSHGMEILKPSPELSADLKKVGDTLLTEWLARAGPEGKELVDKYRK